MSKPASSVVKTKPADWRYPVHDFHPWLGEDSWLCAEPTNYISRIQEKSSPSVRMQIEGWAVGLRFVARIGYTLTLIQAAVTPSFDGKRTAVWADMKKNLPGCMRESRAGETPPIFFRDELVIF